MRWLQFLLPLFAIFLPACTSAAAAANPRYDHVLILSVDGLRPDALAVTGLERLPNFARLLQGCCTLDARCDPDWSVTLPNHVGMLTGRFVEGEHGHGWTLNDMPPPGMLLRPDMDSVIHVATRAGLRTGAFAAKKKFVLLSSSWGPMIQDFGIEESAFAVVGRVCQFWAGSPAPSLAFAHVAEPDAAGHAEGWTLDPDSPYSAAIARVDVALGVLFEWLDAHPEQRAHTAIILTADHGGGVPLKNHHGAERALLNRRIPFLVWTGNGAAHGELYALNPKHYAAPLEQDPDRSASGAPPVRNSDAANLTLDLLGLPPLEDADANPRQELRIVPRSTP